jgi:hypothetical protein
LAPGAARIYACEVRIDDALGRAAGRGQSALLHRRIAARNIAAVPAKGLQASACVRIAASRETEWPILFHSAEGLLIFARKMSTKSDSTSSAEGESR